MRSNRTTRRYGVTLVELLIVMGVLTILATLSLTTVKGLLKDQKISQAGRLVEQYFESARIRALTNGRPVAVFLERVDLTGDASGNPVPGTYTSTRLSIGEVFPPYTGDVLNATGELYDVDFTGARATRVSDSFADQIRIDVNLVFGGFGTANDPGMISIGDTIEIDGYLRRFVIEDIEFIQAGDTFDGTSNQVAITFFNPPGPGSGYNSGGAPYATQEPSIPIPAGVGAVTGSDGASTSTQVGTKGPEARFRVYRKPTKSLVGAITLPRGTCVDMYASGIGPAGFLAPFQSKAGDTTAGKAPATDGQGNPYVPTRSSFSRVAVIFDASGRASGMFRDDKIIAASNGDVSVGFQAFGVDSVLHLLVGKSDQVYLGGLTRPTAADRDGELSNILDPANSWVSINPMTGLITSSPVGAVSDATLTTAIQNNNYALVVIEARALATTGGGNAGN